MKIKLNNIISAKCRFRMYALTVFALPFSLFAAEFYVDPVNGDDAVGLGSRESPFLSIQKAVDSASQDDTVVLFPGDHTAGCTQMTTTDGLTYRVRVSIGKRLVVRSLSGRAGRDSTRIIGMWDISSGAYPYGMGPNAIKCVEVSSKDAWGSRFEGITFCDGAAPYLDGETSDATRGGGVSVLGGNGYAYFADCAFRNCQAVVGAAINVRNGKYAVAARCLFKDNKAFKYGSAAFGVNCFACVFDGNGSTLNEDGRVASEWDDAGKVGVIGSCKMAVNCTFVNSLNRIGYSVPKIGNCIFVNGSHADWSSTVTNIHNLVSDVNPENMNEPAESVTYENSHLVDFAEYPEVYSPFDEDYRLRRGTKSAGTGAQTHIAEFAETFPDVQDMLGTDYYGVEYPAAGSTETVNCGASQEAIGFVSPCLALDAGDAISGSYEINGKTATQCSRTFLGASGCPTAIQVKFTPKSGYALVRYDVNGKISWAKMDGSIWVALLAPGRTSVVKPVVASSITYVDAEKGSDVSGDGSAEAPYETIQKAIDAADKEQNHVIYVRKGDYAEGSTQKLSLETRVALPGGYGHNMLIKGVDGVDATFISGKYGSGDNGKGTDAVRCLALANDATAICVQGFTLRNGRTADSGTDQDTYGAAINTAGAKGAYVVDCVISNCIAQRGIVSGGVLERCKLIDCIVNGRGIVRGSSSKAISSMFRNCTIINGNGIISDGACVYNSTFSGCSKVVRNNNGSQKGYIYNCVVDGNIANPALEADQAYNTLYSTSDKTQVNLATAMKESPILFSDTEGYVLSRDSKGYGLADAGYMMSIMDFNGNPFKVSAVGRYASGAFERDWKDDIVSAAGCRDIEVSSAYSMAEVEGDGISLTSGDLAFSWDVPVSGYYDFHVKMTGNGTLSAFLDDVLLGTYASGFDGDVRFASKAGERKLRFSYVAGEGGPVGGALLSDFGRYVGFRLIVR